MPFTFKTLLALSIIYCAIIFNSKAQNLSADSLKKELSIAVGSARIDILNQLMKGQLCRNNQEAMDYYNQLLEELKVVEYPKGNVESLKNFGTLKYCSGSVDSALFYYEKAGHTAINNNLEKEAGAIYNNIGVMAGLKGDFNKALINYRKVNEIATVLGDTTLLIASLNGMGDVYRKKGFTDSALFNFLAAEKISLKKQDKRMLLASKINIAAIYVLSDRQEKLAETDLLESIKLSEEIGDSASKASLLQILGSFMFKESEYLKSLEYLNKGLEAIESTGNVTIKVYLLQGIGNVYYKLQEHEKAIEFNSRSIELAEKAGLNAVLPLLYANNASNNLALLDYKKAIENCLKSISYSSGTEQLEETIDVYKYLAEAYNGIGAYKEAYEAQAMYSKLNSDFRDKAQSKRLSEIEVRYETEKKELEIASLSQLASIKDLEIKQKNQVMLIGFIVIVLVSGFTYFIYRQRSLENKQKQTALEQRFLRSQLNPHFIANALMAIQTFMLKNQADKAAIYLAKFSKLMREILENSRQEFIRVEDEIQMLTNYLDIHRVRLNESFDYTIEVDDTIDIETDAIPPMFVQPFIENAIEHGITNAKTKGQIKLKLFKEGEYISIEITDNGAGLVKDRQSIKEHTSLSTTIIQERMALFNKSLKKKIQLVLGNILDESGEVNGTKVELKVPYSYL